MGTLSVVQLTPDEPETRCTLRYAVSFPPYQRRRSTGRRGTYGLITDEVVSVPIGSVLLQPIGNVSSDATLCIDSGDWTLVEIPGPQSLRNSVSDDHLTVWLTAVQDASDVMTGKHGARCVSNVLGEAYELLATTLGLTDDVAVVVPDESVTSVHRRLTNSRCLVVSHPAHLFFSVEQVCVFMLRAAMSASTEAGAAHESMIRGGGMYVADILCAALGIPFHRDPEATAYELFRDADRRDLILAGRHTELSDDERSTLYYLVMNDWQGASRPENSSSVGSHIVAVAERLPALAARARRTSVIGPLQRAHAIQASPPPAAAPRREPGQDADCRVTTILYTSESRGHLEDCGCTGSDVSGIKHLAPSLERVIASRSGCIALDLGHVVDVPPRREALEAIDLLELEFALGELRNAGVTAMIPSLRDYSFGDAVPGVARAAGIQILSSGGGTVSTLDASVHGKRLSVIPFSDAVGGLLESDVHAMAQHDHADELPNLVEALHAVETAVSKGTDYVIVAGQSMTAASVRALASHPRVNLVLIGDNISGLVSVDPMLIEGTAVVWGNEGASGFREVRVCFTHRHAGGCVPRVVPHPARRTPGDDDIHDRLEELYRLATGQLPWEPSASRFDAAMRETHYVGSTPCQSCHAEQFRQWESTRHATAMGTLRKVHRDFVPKCVSCHVVGMGHESGYSMRDPLPSLENVGCEACHGPGRDHVERLGSSALRPVSKASCYSCHDTEHSPGFDATYVTRLEGVRH